MPRTSRCTENQTWLGRGSHKISAGDKTGFQATREMSGFSGCSRVCPGKSQCFWL
jgi:hypothetical protein